MLVEIGYKEIEVAFPAASQTDFDFVRRLVEEPGLTPDDVWLQVLSPCREDLIRRTVDSLRGTKKAILHIYLATSPCFRRIVFNMDRQKSLEMAVRCTKFARSITKDDPTQAGTEWQFEFSPETFSDTEPDFAVEVCQAVKEAWEPSTENPIIFNLPATVEMATPNIFADQIEYFCTNMTEREKFVVSVHPHNDRGCAVAAAELAQMGGAQRVEGTLFGNGERTGNVDLVTLALNLYTQGVSPKVDFSDINAVIKVVEESNKIPINERWPYVSSDYSQFVTENMLTKTREVLSSHRLSVEVTRTPSRRDSSCARRPRPPTITNGSSPTSPSTLKISAETTKLLFGSTLRVARVVPLGLFCAVWSWISRAPCRSSSARLFRESPRPSAASSGLPRLSTCSSRHTTSSLTPAST